MKKMNPLCLALAQGVHVGFWLFLMVTCNGEVKGSS